MTIVLDLKKILVFIKSRARLLVVSGLIGFSLAVTINLVSPKLYEAYFEFQLARVLLKAEGLAAKEPHWVTIPQAVDARRILMSPMKISQSIVEACGYMDTNENRKNLINQIQVNALNSAGAEMFVYIRIDGKEAARKCAEAILAMQITNSNAELDKYIQSASNPITDKKIVKIFPATPSGGIRVSSDYVYPRVFLNLVAYMFIAIFMGLFFDWVYFRLHAALRG